VIPNLHPPLTAFPVALLVLLMAAEIAELFGVGVHQARRFMLAALVLTVPLTYFSGTYGSAAFSDAPVIVNEAIGGHQRSAKMLILSLVPTVLFGFARGYFPPKERGVRIAYWISLSTALVLVLYCSSLGGTLVFEYGVGVRAETR
jgi:uncharacterized membrane protein